MTFEATYYLVTGLVLGLSARPLLRRLCRWAEGLRIEVEAERLIRARRHDAPRAVPEPRNLRLLRTPYDQGRVTS